MEKKGLVPSACSKIVQDKGEAEFHPLRMNWVATDTKAQSCSGTPASISLQEPSQKRKKPLETVGKPFQIICLAWDI